jgi:[histone H3]-lysine4 N-trimethyltransferase ASH1L
MAEIDLISADIALEAAATDSSSHSASMSSTPPTTVSPDNISLASDLSKAEHSQLALQDDSVDLHEPEQAIAAQLIATAQTAHIEHISQHALPRHAPDSVRETNLPIFQLLSSHKEIPQPEAPAILTAPAIVVAHSPTSAHAPVSSPATASPARPRRVGADAKIYNIAKLVGTDIHGKRASKGDDISKRRRRTKEINDAYRNAIAAGASEEAANEARARVQAEHQAASAASSANSTPRVKKVRSVKHDTPKSSPAKLALARKASSASPGSSRAAIHASFAQTPSFVSKPSTLGKRDRKSFESQPDSGSRMSRELRRLQDTKEYAHIDEKPVVYTVWSKGKYVEVEDVDDPIRTPPRKKAKLSKSPKKEETPQKKEVTFAVEKARRQKVPKKWLERGLYAGQAAPEDITKTLIATEKKKLAEHPELLPWKSTNKALPLPLFNGFRMLLNGRDFKLPFDICNPLPPGQPKPPSYRTMTRSENARLVWKDLIKYLLTRFPDRFVGDSAAYWKKTPHFQDYQSTCICKPEDGCGEQCQNRVMLYECTAQNCNIGRQYCTNRAFDSLSERVKQGGRYRVGVEVFKTENRGFGVRSNRCFQPRQIVMEYSGEIITEDECDDRMHGIYKDNEVIWFMSAPL